MHAYASRSQSSRGGSKFVQFDRRCVTTCSKAWGGSSKKLSSVMGWSPGVVSDTATATTDVSICVHVRRAQRKVRSPTSMEMRWWG